MLGGVGGSAVAAAIALLLLFAPRAGLLDQLVDAHVHSLSPGHMIAVVSTDRHTVKPWFAGRTDVSPVVVDFADQGYRLVGGRTDAIDGQRAAVVVYQHGAHFINVFSWKSPGGAPAADSHAQRLPHGVLEDRGPDVLRGLGYRVVGTAGTEAAAPVRGRARAAAVGFLHGGGITAPSA